ncbi:uracil-DNA glycosylase [Microbacterium sp. NPDC089189]|uniref:uracil-DNA glycosylase n=1 Tax=Microbacterium sp. NPDC089189 TaxID=3154972 RepID=UPI00344009C2
MFLDHPRGFRDPALIDARERLLLTEPTVQSLRAWADDLADRRGAVVPQFDPAEGGDQARVLFVFEAPGPMTNAGNTRPGSGFISVDNNDATAANMWNARAEVGLHTGALAWNIVPWYLGAASRKPTAAELGQGAAELVDLIGRLPRLEIVVLGGRYAQKGWRRHIGSTRFSGPDVVDLWHPSPLSLNQPGRRDAFVETLRGVAQRLE